MTMLRLKILGDGPDPEKLPIIGDFLYNLDLGTTIRQNIVLPPNADHPNASKPYIINIDLTER